MKGTAVLDEGVAEECVRVVQDKYEDSETVVTCTRSDRWVRVGVALHHRSALSNFLIAVELDRLSEVRQESPRVCNESREQAGETLQGWRHASEKKGMKVRFLGSGEMETD